MPDRLHIYRAMLPAPEDDAPRYHSFGDEIDLSEAIHTRAPDALERISDFYRLEHFGTARDEAHTILIAAVTAIGLLSRWFMRAGMVDVYAFAISDEYLRRLWLGMTFEETREVVLRAAETFLSYLPSHGSRGGPPEETAESRIGVSGVTVRAMNYVLRNIRAPLTVECIAETLFVSPDHLSARFHRDTGMTLTRYIRRHKIAMAKELLETAHGPCSEIGTILSYSSASHFSRVFKQETGMTPLAYRRMCQAAGTPE